MRLSHGRLLPDFAKQSVVLRPEKRVQHFTPPPASVVGPFVPPHARARLQAEAPRGKETRLCQVCSTETAERSFAKRLRQRSAKIDMTEPNRIVENVA
jgi:hypothetical protein